MAPLPLRFADEFRLAGDPQTLLIDFWSFLNASQSALRRMPMPRSEKPSWASISLRGWPPALPAAAPCSRSSTGPPGRTRNSSSKKTV